MLVNNQQFTKEYDMLKLLCFAVYKNVSNRGQGFIIGHSTIAPSSPSPCIFGSQTVTSLWVI